MTPVTIFQCNEWKEYSSFRLLGVFTNRKKMQRALKKLVEINAIDYCGDNIQNEDVDGLNSKVTYATFYEINLNQIQ